MVRMAGLLRPGGVLAVASFGPSNLCEVHRLSGLALPYPSLDEWRTALAGHSEVLVAREDMRTLWFPSAHDMLRHLKETGVDALDAQPWGAGKAIRFCKAYAGTFGRDGIVPLTYHPVFLVARKHNEGGVCS